MLATKMLSLLPSPGLRQALGEAGRQRAAREFSMEHYCQSIERIIVEETTAGFVQKGRIPPS
jgi:glycosyltransferase involved in cell wall biosynthesis